MIDRGDQFVGHPYAAHHMDEGMASPTFRSASMEKEQEMEDFMQPVAHLADELRSEDPAARVEAMKRLSTIALALGQERTRTELVPFLEST